MPSALWVIMRPRTAARAPVSRGLDDGSALAVVLVLADLARLPGGIEGGQSLRQVQRGCLRLRPGLVSPERIAYGISHSYLLCRAHPGRPLPLLRPAVQGGEDEETESEEDTEDGKEDEGGHADHCLSPGNASVAMLSLIFAVFRARPPAAIASYVEARHCIEHGVPCSVNATSGVVFCCDNCLHVVFSSSALLAACTRGNADGKKRMASGKAEPGSSDRAAY